MEDFAGAESARFEDLHVLEAAQRTTFAMHTGGVVIECQMKAMIASYHNIREWNEPGRRKKDPRHNQPIPNPKHGLLAALKTMDSLHRVAKTDPLLLQHLDAVMHPLGPSGEGFVEIRYHADSNAAASTAAWQKSFNYVRGWLKKNKRAL